MNPLNHTPGPWLAIPTTVHGRNPDTKRMDIVSNSGEWHPAFVAGDILPSDARLIASAPELLRALEQLLETAESLNDWLVSDGSINGEHELFEKVRAIISKAKGEA